MYDFSNFDFSTAPIASPTASGLYTVEGNVYTTKPQLFKIDSIDFFGDEKTPRIHFVNEEGAKVNTMHSSPEYDKNPNNLPMEKLKQNKAQEIVWLLRNFSPKDEFNGNNLNGNYPDWQSVVSRIFEYCFYLQNKNNGKAYLKLVFKEESGESNPYVNVSYIRPNACYHIEEQALTSLKNLNILGQKEYFVYTKQNKPPVPTSTFPKPDVSKPVSFPNPAIATNPVNSQFPQSTQASNPFSSVPAGGFNPQQGFPPKPKEEDKLEWE